MAIITFCAINIIFQDENEIWKFKVWLQKFQAYFLTRHPLHSEVIRVSLSSIILYFFEIAFSIKAFYQVGRAASTLNFEVSQENDVGQSLRRYFQSKNCIRTLRSDFMAPRRLTTTCCVQLVEGTSRDVLSPQFLLRRLSWRWCRSLRCC